MADKNGWCIACCILGVVAIILAVTAIVMSGITLHKQLNDSNNHDKSTSTSADKVDTSHTISLLTNETKDLKVAYMNLLSVTKAINFTTSATVQRVVDELNHVKETQRVIQERLQPSSHLNDSTEDCGNLREEVKNLTRHMNQNINRLEGKVNENRGEWQDGLENKTSEIYLKISDLEKRLDLKEFENPQNKTNVTSDATGLQLGLRKASYLLFYAVIFFTPLGIIANS